MLTRDRVFIGGEWVPSSGTEVLTVINPATEEVIAAVPRGTADDVGRAAQAAAAAFPEWSRSSPVDRAEMFSKLGRLIEDRADELAEIIVQEVGQPASVAKGAQALSAATDLDIIAQSLGEITWHEPSGDTVIHRVPAGVVGAITPWNAPLRTICTKAGAAIAAGCTVVLKGSEVAPLTSFLFAELFAEAGLPAGVLNVVSGTGVEVGEAIASHPAVDMVSLTGSVRAGRRVLELAAPTIKRTSLELGGKSANIICADADLQRAVADGIEDAFRISGQVCGGLTRMLVPRHQLAQAEELAVLKAESYVLGDPFDPETTLGPVTTASQRDRVRDYIRSGLTEGARMLTGGPDAPEGLDRGYFVRPTIFTADNQARIAREEIFGPVVVIIPYADESEAVAIANDSDYGLVGQVWAADPERARSIASMVRAGRMRINGSPVNQRAPHGGFKFSGIGREWGRFGVEDFLELQAIG